MTNESQPPYAPPRAFLEVPEAPEDTPRQILRAVNLLWVSFVLGLIETGLRLTFDPSLADDVGLVLFFAVLMTALYAFAVISVSKRKNWARILLLINVLATPAYLLYPWELPDPWWTTALFAFSFVIEATAVFWLFSGPGARWYAEGKAQ